MNWTECGSTGDTIEYSSKFWDSYIIESQQLIRHILQTGRYAGVESVRGDIGWRTVKERLIKTQPMHKIWLEKMAADCHAMKVYNHIGYENKWKLCEEHKYMWSQEMVDG